MSKMLLLEFDLDKRTLLVLSFLSLSISRKARPRMTLLG
ncbi:hypothetical protein Patl1_02643 [Pistacia atlantica]|uniref:Uncharacterized protein n=1 Tax=Pistacia atlantica TaxID=434234 RepID=A0ACC1CBX4_9ROSI|nr:hypothetical protein Patl1_02643 [Pistacia atlantica]